MHKRLKNFIYSQNSINTYKSCPQKFNYKYIQNINWKHDDVESRAYYENLKSGSEFHLICERYFMGIELGINEHINDKFANWISKVKKLIPINNSDIYLPEYEIRFKCNDNVIQAKYDLLIIKDNEIEIWDWKTENRKLDYSKLENRMQSIIYMYLAKEVIPKLYNFDNDIKISMKYYQPEFYDECVTISYNNDKHIKNEIIIKDYINKIINTNYDDTTNNSYDIIKNKKHCDYCEYDKLCNNNIRENNILEED